MLYWEGDIYNLSVWQLLDTFSSKNHALWLRILPQELCRDAEAALLLDSGLIAISGATK
jgi:hypothetical protein